MKKVKKNYLKNSIKKAHANFQTMVKTPVKFQKDRFKTVEGVALTRYLLQTRNHAPSITHHAPCTTESQIPCPLVFLRTGGGQKSTDRKKIRIKTNRSKTTKKQQQYNSKNIKTTRNVSVSHRCPRPWPSSPTCRHFAKIMKLKKAP